MILIWWNTLIGIPPARESVIRSDIEKEKRSLRKCGFGILLRYFVSGKDAPLIAVHKKRREFLPGAEPTGVVLNQSIKR
jgi:hypothetical protein